MTVLTATPDLFDVDSPPDPDHLVLEEVSWAFYQRFLREIGDRTLRVTYNDGRMEIMSPLPEHEKPSRAIAMFVGLFTMELLIPIATLGSTTFRSKKKAKGLEPDECFYIQNERLIRGKNRLDLRRDPPPDLALEMEVTNRAVPKLPIYAALGVPEVWRYDGRELVCLQFEWRRLHCRGTQSRIPVSPPPRFGTVLGAFGQ